MTIPALETSISDIKLEASWKAVLKNEFQKEYFIALKSFLLEEKQQGYKIYPPGALMFNAFNLTLFEKVKVVILGQDPYHGEGQAHGLSFSVPEGIPAPPSLKNIYKELHNDIGFNIPKHGNLTKWAERGVFLLNAILSVRANVAASHQKKGWEQFTDQVIAQLSEQRTGIVFLLWGKYAQGKEKFIDQSKHLILKAAHPSPLAGGAFFGSKPFSQTNAYLEQHGQEPINWSLD